MCVTCAALASPLPAVSAVALLCVARWAVPVAVPGCAVAVAVPVAVPPYHCHCHLSDRAQPSTTYIPYRLLLRCVILFQI